MKARIKRSSLPNLHKETAKLIRFLEDYPDAQVNHETFLQLVVLRDALQRFPLLASAPDAIFFPSGPGTDEEFVCSVCDRVIEAAAPFVVALGKAWHLRCDANPEQWKPNDDRTG